MSYEEKILRLHPGVVLGLGDAHPSQVMDVGHDQARINAAKIAAEADAEIKKLKNDNARLRLQVDTMRPFAEPPLSPAASEFVANQPALQGSVLHPRAAEVEAGPSNRNCNGCGAPVFVNQDICFGCWSDAVVPGHADARDADATENKA